MRRRGAAGGVIGLIIALATFFFARAPGRAQAPRAPERPAAQAPAPAPTARDQAPGTDGVAHPEIGFRTRQRFEEHFAKHGREFGDITAAEYLRRAQALRDRPAGGDVLEAVRPDDHVISRFDRASGAFLAYDPDLVIRTFFRPNDGENYFRRQLRRAH